MEPDDLLCSRNARPQKALAWVNGTSRRANGWAGEKDVILSILPGDDSYCKVMELFAIFSV
jgi:hypothetical protein